MAITCNGKLARLGQASEPPHLKDILRCGGVHTRTVEFGRVPLLYGSGLVVLKRRVVEPHIVKPYGVPPPYGFTKWWGSPHHTVYDEWS